MGEPMIEFNQVKEGDGRNFLQGFGGDTSNFAIAAARQGATVGYISALGRDANGASLRALWDEEGVDHSLVSTHATAPTGMYFVTHGPQGHEFSFARAGSPPRSMAPAMCPSRRLPRPRRCISPAFRSPFRTAPVMPATPPLRRPVRRDALSRSTPTSG